MGRLKYWRQTPATRFEAILRQRQGRSVTADFTLWDETGNCVAELSNCRFRAVPLPNISGEIPAACWETLAVLCPNAREAAQSPSGKVARWVIDLQALMGEPEFEGERLALFQEGLPLFDALAMAFACRAFDQLGQALDAWVRDDSCCPVSVRPYFRWLRAQLQREGWLRENAGQWQLVASELPAPEEIWRTLLQEYPQALPELVQLGHVGRHLADLLTGRIDL
ncbi:type I polyketide synthase WcbR, partial [mine drainage metagenome]